MSKKKKTTEIVESPKAQPEAEKAATETVIKPEVESPVVETEEPAEVENPVAEVIAELEQKLSESEKQIADLSDQLEEANQRAADAETKLEAKAEVKTKKAKSTSPSFTFAKGTVLYLGDQKINLIEDSEVFFDAAAHEPLVAGMLTVAKQLEINQDKLKANYDGNGLLVVEDDGVDQQAEV